MEDELGKFRMLSGCEIRLIFERTQSDIGKKCSFVWKSQLQDKPLLTEGTGFILGYRLGRYGHAVAVYRCLDGSVIYHDSCLSPVPEFISDYFRTYGVYRLYKATRRQQKSKYKTCVYHAFSFLSYAISHSRFGPLKLISRYDKHVGSTDSERKVIKCVEKIISEIRPRISLHTTDTDDSILPSQKSLTSRKRKSDSDDENSRKRGRME